MRGGVSLAVWIGGAVAEIETLRKASQASDQDATTASVYQRLLKLANYGEVEVDILTGASAGGLNGAIYAASLVYGFDFAAMADVWLQLADVEALSRPATATTGGKALSLFDGDGYFLKKCEQELNRFVVQQLEDNGHQPLTAQVTRLDLFLSATRLVATDKVLRNDAFNDILESRSSALFHFRHLGQLESPLSDFGADPGVQPVSYQQSLSRLAQSGRASSSFPVAFEPAKITSVASAPTGDNLFGIFSEIGTDVEVIDGGVLDNIPVAMAIEAIAAAPAKAPTSRWLLYLHPSPPEIEAEPTESASNLRKGSEFLGILRDLKATLTLKFNNESLVDDMVELDRHNQRVSERRSARRGLLETATRDGLDCESACASWSEADARQVRLLLADPAAATTTHPFVRVAYGDLAPEWTSAKRSALDQNLAEAIEEHYRTASVMAPESTDDSENGDRRPSLPLIAFGDTVEVLLGIAQQVYVEGGEPQRVLYRVRLLVEVLNAIWEQSWLEAAQDAPGDDPAAVTAWMRRTALECMVRSEALSAELIAAVQADEPAERDVFHGALRAHYDARVACEFEAEDVLWPMSELWAIIEPLAQKLVAEAAQLDDPIVDALTEALRDPDLGLGWFATVCAPVHRRHNDGESEIKFLRVAGTNASPLGHLFTSQLVDGKLTVQNKLAGNQVANFGAFFSAQWRANDWMWGQLDTAKSLVDLLADSQRWFVSKSLTPEEVVREITHIVDTPFVAGADHEGSPGWTEWLREQWDSNRDKIEQELDAAFAAADSSVSYPLTITKQLLVARLQAEILSTQLEWVCTTGETATSGPSQLHGALDYDQTVQRARALTAGVDKLPGALDTKRWARIGMRLGFNAWNALAPTGWKRFIVMGFKPLYLFVLAVVAFPRRALFAGLLGFGVLGVGRWETRADTESDWLGADVLRTNTVDSEFFTWQRLTATTLAALLGALAGYLQLSRQLPGTLKCKPLVAAAGTAALGLTGAGMIGLIVRWQTGIWLLGFATVFAAGFATVWIKNQSKGAEESWALKGWILVLLASLLGGALLALTAFETSVHPFSLPIVAVIVVAVGMNWIPIGHRIALAALSAGTYLSTLAVLYLIWQQQGWTPATFPLGWWALGSFALAVSVTTTYVSQVDVFPKARS